MAKSLLKKAKKAVKKESDEMRRKELRNKDTKAEDRKRVYEKLSVPKSPSVSIREHIEKLSGERGDCFTIWTLIKNTEIYTTDEKIKKLIKLKEFDTLLGEIS